MVRLQEKAVQGNLVKCTRFWPLLPPPRGRLESDSKLIDDEGRTKTNYKDQQDNARLDKTYYDTYVQPNTELYITLFNFIHT